MSKKIDLELDIYSVGINSRLDIAEKINEPENRNRKYPMGNTEKKIKTKKIEVEH